MLLIGLLDECRAPLLKVHDFVFEVELMQHGGLVALLRLVVQLGNLAVDLLDLLRRRQLLVRKRLLLLGDLLAQSLDALGVVFLQVLIPLRLRRGRGVIARRQGVRLVPGIPLWLVRRYIRRSS